MNEPLFEPPGFNELEQKIYKELEHFGVKQAMAHVTTDCAHVVIKSDDYAVTLSTSNKYYKGGENSQALVKIGPYQFVYSLYFENIDGLVRAPGTDVTELVEGWLAQIVFEHQRLLFIRAGVKQVFTDSIKIYPSQTDMFQDEAALLKDEGLCASSFSSDLICMGFEVCADRNGKEGSIPAWIRSLNGPGIKLVEMLERNWFIPEDRMIYIIQGPDTRSGLALILICTENIVRAMHFIDLHRVQLWESMSLRGDSVLHNSIVRTLLLPLLYGSNDHALTVGSHATVLSVSKYPGPGYINSVEIKRDSEKRAGELRFELCAIDKANLEYFVREDEETVFLEAEWKRVGSSPNAPAQLTKAEEIISTDLVDVVPYFQRENLIPDTYDQEGMVRLFDSQWERFTKAFS